MQAHYPRIAFLLASAHTGAARGLWPELIAAAQSHRCILFVLPGGRLNAIGGFEYMRNDVYRYAQASNIDSALCWASTLSGYATESAVESFLIDTVDVPMVTFGLKIDGQPFVGIDAYSGMKALVKHFIRNHKRKHIAFIAGPRQHSSAEERYSAYCDALKEAHISYDSRLVCLDTPWSEGRRAMLDLIDGRGLVPGKDFDALCTASDLLAFEAGIVLRERGIEIPSTISIGGFNDSEESRIFSPPLTTVRMPFTRQVLSALRLLIDMSKGNPSDDILLKTKLVIRSSCGCVPQAFQMAGRTRVKARKSLPPSLIEAFSASLASQKNNSFFEHLEKIFDEDRSSSSYETGMLENMLTALRLEFLSRASSRDEIDKIEKLIHQAMVALGLSKERKHEYLLWKEKEDEQKLNLFNQELLCAKDIQSIIKAAAAHLPGLGILSGYLVTKDKQGNLMFKGGYRKSKDTPYAEMIYPRPSREAIPRALFLPERIMPTEPGAYFILPLFYESTDLGHLVIQAADIDPSLYEEIRSILSSALRGVKLFEEGDEARKRAERAEKSMSDIVSVISREIQSSIEAFDKISKLGAKGTQELEVSRLKELVRYLIDLSQAKSESVLTRAVLFDPYRFCAHWAQNQLKTDKTNGKRTNRSESRLMCARPSSVYPLLFGDPKQLERMLTIVVQLLEETFHIEELEISIVPSIQNCELRLDSVSKIPKEIAASGLNRIEKDIRFELAKQICLLHGGHILFSHNGGFLQVRIELPYPTVSGSIHNIPNREIEPCVIGPQGLSEHLPYRFLDEFSGKIIPYNSIFQESISPSQRILLYLDSAEIDHESSAALSFILDKERFQNAECFIAQNSSSIMETRLDNKPADVSGLLRSVLVSDSPSAIPILGSEASLQREIPIIRHVAQQPGIRLVACTSPEAFEAASNRWRPVLFLVLEPTILKNQEFSTLLQRFPSVPLMAICRFFGAKEEWAAIIERPHTVFCNTGEVFSEVLANLIQRSLEGKKFLPSPTGGIVADAIFYMNKSYSEQISRWKMASYLNTSEDYLSRIFHTQMGISLWNYLARLRVQHAIGLLYSTGAGLAEIADLTGFQDEAYFCRVFKRIAGTTPGYFRSRSFLDVRKVQESD